MLSSTITELSDLRSAAEARVKRAAIADAWLFEMHAVASGAAPDEQYLTLARTCDLYVVIVASQHSEATEAEYEMAYSDNPEKVLPFFVGNGSEDVREFRNLLESRHTRLKRPHALDLVDPIAEAIVQTVRSGKILRPGLIRVLNDRIESSRRLVSDVRAIFEPKIIVEERIRTARDYFQPGAHVALSGIGGSGKTLCAALSARRLGARSSLLPIYAPCRCDVTRVEDLIARQLSALRFEAGDDTVRGWAVEGRIFLVVDGIEALDAPGRRTLMESLSNWSQSYPRCGVVVCARRFASGELVGFTHSGMAPLTDAEISQIAGVLGARTETFRFPEQVADIARWPMWTTALIVFGLEARTGLELLQALITARLETAGMTAQVERAELRALAGFVAWSLWPDVETEVDELLAIVDRWRSAPDTRGRFQPRSTEDLIERLSRAGLLEIAETASIPHRLLATILAGDYAASDGTRSMAADDELAPFVAALLNDEDHVEILHHLLADQNIFVLARFLRLAPPSARNAAFTRDAHRIGRAFQRWTRTGQHLEVVSGEGWVAWRPSTHHESRSALSAGDYLSWRASSTEPIYLWQHSPFADRTPEFLAALCVLSQFRSRVLSCYPQATSSREPTSSEIQALLHDRAQLKARVLEVFRLRREARETLLTEMGLDGEPALRTSEDEPQVVVAPGGEDPSVWITWGSGAPSVSVGRSQANWQAGSSTSLKLLLGQDVDEVAFQSIERDIERELGCRLGSQSWGRPELVPAWAW